MEPAITVPGPKVAVAIREDQSSSQWALKWALDNRVVTAGGVIYLLHVQAPVLTIPSPIGNIPLTNANEDVVSHYKKQRSTKAEKIVQQHVLLCKERKVEAKVWYNESVNIFESLVQQINKHGIEMVILEISFSPLLSTFSRHVSKVFGRSVLAERNIPEFCSVRIVYKNKVVEARNAKEGIPSPPPNRLQDDEDHSIKDEQSCKRRRQGERTTTAVVQWDSEVVHGNADEERATVKEKQEAILEALKGYRHYTFQELQQATDNFSDTMKLGEGHFGAVYKGILQHTTVAVKVLRTEGVQGLKELQQEVEVLSQVHHPHVVMLIGACPEEACIVFEYMANGSLADCLQRKNLPSHARLRICFEVAAGLLFLHSCKPKGVVHRDLKPANILLDHNLVSKIGDVGLARFVPKDSSTMPAGTIGYLDPEYLRTYSFGPHCDVFALGIIMLQLLTGKPAPGLLGVVEKAVNSRQEFQKILDWSAGCWSVQQALEVAHLSLRCAARDPNDRPDLENDILVTLAKIRQAVGIF